MRTRSAIDLFGDKGRQANFIFSDFVLALKRADNISKNEEPSIIFLKRCGRIARAYSAIYVDPRTYEQKLRAENKNITEQELKHKIKKQGIELPQKKMIDYYFSFIKDDHETMRSLRTDYTSSLINTFNKLNESYKDHAVGSEDHYKKAYINQVCNHFLNTVALRSHDFDTKNIKNEEHHREIIEKSFSINIDDMMERADIMLSALYQFVKIHRSSYVDLIHYFLLFTFKLGFYQLEQVEEATRKVLINEFSLPPCELAISQITCGCFLIGFLFS